MDDDTPWLDEAEQRAWRGWLAVNARVTAALHRDLQRRSDLSLSDFDVLVHLTESHDGKERVSVLARALEWDRSRVSHHVTRMERRGLVAREDCEDDARGSFVVVTDEGRTAIEAAAPDHVRTVRDLMLDPLTNADLAALTRIDEKILARLDERAD